MGTTISGVWEGPTRVKGMSRISRIEAERQPDTSLSSHHPSEWCFPQVQSNRKFGTQLLVRQTNRFQECLSGLDAPREDVDLHESLLTEVA